MRVAFFSEMGSYSGVRFPRDFANMRTDVAWAVALNAHVLELSSHLSFNSAIQPMLDTGFHFDLGIIIVPKKYPEQAFKCLEYNKKCCKVWATMQEANQTYWQNGSVHEQIMYINFLHDCDMIFCHNEMDKKYYSGLIPGKRVEVLQSLMIEEALPKLLTKPEDRSGCMIGGNWTEWYSGQDSFFIAQEFEGKIHAPSMGRKHSEEGNIEEITYLPYLNWTQWIEELSKRKYGVHLMRTYAAGTFALNCARLGIPCIGWDFMDTQTLCFPQLSFKEGDMVSARKAAANLRDNRMFYAHCAGYAERVYADTFAENKFVERFNSYF